MYLTEWMFFSGTSSHGLSQTKGRQMGCCCFVVSITNVSPAETAEPIGTTFVMWTSGCPRNHLLDGRLDPPLEGALLMGTY